MTHPTDSSHLGSAQEKVFRLMQMIERFKVNGLRGYEIIITLTKEDFDDIMGEYHTYNHIASPYTFMGYYVEIGNVSSVGIQLILP